MRFPFLWYFILQKQGLCLFAFTQQICIQSLLCIETGCLGGQEKWKVSLKAGKGQWHALWCQTVRFKICLQQWCIWASYLASSVQFQFNCSVVSDSLQPHELQHARLLCLWGPSRQEFWSGLPSPTPGDLSNPGIKPRSPELQADSLPPEPSNIYIQIYMSYMNSLSKVYILHTYAVGAR